MSETEKPDEREQRERKDSIESDHDGTRDEKIEIKVHKGSRERAKREREREQRERTE
jgi:hypothetical protein